MMQIKPQTTFTDDRGGCYQTPELALLALMGRIVGNEALARTVLEQRPAIEGLFANYDTIKRAYDAPTASEENV